MRNIEPVRVAAGTERKWEGGRLLTCIFRTFNTYIISNNFVLCCWASLISTNRPIPKHLLLSMIWCNSLPKFIIIINNYSMSARWI